MIPICFQLHRFRYLRVHDEHLDWEKLINGHQEILNAILHSNVYLADARIFNHLHLMLEEADQVMQDFPDYLPYNQNGNWCIFCHICCLRTKIFLNSFLSKRTNN